MVKSNPVNKIIAFGIFLVLAIISFLIIKPFIAGIFLAILLASIFKPIYHFLNKYLNNPSVSAFLVTVLSLLVLVIFAVISLEIVANQVMSFYAYTKTTDIMAPLKAVMVKIIEIDPTQFSFLFDVALEKGTSYIINFLSNLVFQVPLILMQGIVTFFTMFYFLRDGDKILDYFKSVLPFKEEVKNRFIERFKEVTNGVIRGSIIVGILQGITAGIGFYIFGVKGAFVLTLIAILLSILPLGPWILWIPIGIDMLISGKTLSGVGLLIYGAVIITYIDNILKPYLIGSKINLSPVIIIIGMLGGAMVFGFIGLFVGPIILSYLLLFMEFYKSSIKEVI
ncbi:MAG: AI-2E family transporter [Nanoarchaeota archaeon]|nr:AI-2E family transporter [Nanoarchaeota archaeon]